MPNDDLQRRMPIEEPVRDHAGQRQTHALREGEEGSDELFAVRPEFVVEDSCGVALAQVEGSVQGGAG